MIDCWSTSYVNTGASLSTVIVFDGVVNTLPDCTWVIEIAIAEFCACVLGTVVVTLQSILFVVTGVIVWPISTTFSVDNGTCIVVFHDNWMESPTFAQMDPVFVRFESVILETRIP